MVAVGAILVAALVGIGIASVRDPRLRVFSDSSGPVLSSPTAYPPPTTDYLDYSHGPSAFVSVLIMNNGRWGITVTGVDLPATLFRPTSYRMNERSFTFDVATSRGQPMHAVPVGHHQLVEVMVRGTFAACTSGLNAVIDRARVHYRMLGVPHTVEVRLDRPIEIVNGCGLATVRM
jgi:hypothetical protein